MKLITTTYCFLASAVVLLGQSETIAIKKSYDVDDPSSFQLKVENINGDVEVVGYDGSTIDLDLEIKIFEKRSGGIAQGKQDLSLGEYEMEDGLLLTMDAPWIDRVWKNGRVHSRHFHDQPRSFDYRYTFRLKVPRSMAVVASTVNKGDVKVEQVAGALSVHNVNGHIEVIGAYDIQEAMTVNGDISIRYARNQQVDARFHTINGDITLSMLEGWSGEVMAESMQGDFFTSFEFQYLPAKLERTTEGDDGGTVYKIGEKNAVAIGSGRGPKIEFETLNGDIYLKRI